MKTNIKKLHLALLALLMSFATFAQVESTINQGYYTFGINGGWAYQQSDICADDGGFGLGLTLGKNLYYKQNAPLSFDLRGRLMYAQMLGLNHERTLAIEQNSAVNGEDGENPNYLIYPTEFNIDEPYVFENNQTHLVELGLEGVVTLNKLRENTGIIASVFGGVGLDYYNTFTDQREGFQGGEYYDLYAGIDGNSSKSNTLKTLRNGLDGNYETQANGVGDAGKLTWMPSLGVELGYELTPTWAIKAGHKATWARDNTIDGSQWSDNQNDLWHYTSIGMEWKIRAGKSARAPQVKITVPQQDPYTTYDPAGFVRANIKNVNSSADVTCTVNGQQVPFDFYSDNFSASIPLRVGQNKVVVRATNIGGEDSDSVLIILKEDNGGSTGPPVVSSPTTGNPNNGNPNNGPRPVVDFTNPPRDNYRVQDKRFVLRADVRNVQYRKDIRLIVNDRETTNFSFDANRNQLVSTINLNPGNNGVKIIATNRNGNDTEERCVILGNNNPPPPPNIAKPIVDIVDPYGNPHQTQQSSTALRATVKNVDRKSDVQVIVNGSRINNYSFSGINVSANITLREGNNTIVVKGTNAGGTASDQVKVFYKRPVVNKNPPVVTFRKPTSTTTVNTSTTPIEVAIKNVNNKNDIIFKVNNQRVYDFSFNGGVLRKTIQVRSGNNPVYVKATNQDGADDASVTIRFISPVSLPKPPSVNITQPTGSTYSATTSTTKIRATIKNVQSKNNISFKVNNQSRNFSYNTSTGILNATITLTEGNNNVVIKATNNDGTDDDSVRIRYAVAAPKLPTVTITTPSNNATVTKPTTTVKATLKNVPSKSGVVLKVNGVKNTNFTYNNGILTTTVTLKVGLNTIFVEGTNNDGKASDSAKVTYRQIKPEPKPTVVFTNPSKKGTMVQRGAFTVKATVRNVKTKSDIALMVNGRKVNIKTFDPKSGAATAAVQLRAGKNVFIMTATNRAGSASANSDITLKTVSPANPKPKVTITSLSSPVVDPLNPTVARSTVLAKIENIQNSNQITFIVNGQTVTSYSYNAKSGAFQALINLQPGENKVQITASTRAGSDTKSKTVTL